MQIPTESDTSTHIADLAARHGLHIDRANLSINEAGLDYRVAFAQAVDGTDWVLRVPRRPDVSAKVDEERRILEFIEPLLTVRVPKWQISNTELIAYHRLPGEPGLTLDDDGQPVWHFDPTSPVFAAALGRLIADLHAVNVDSARQAHVPAMSALDVRSQWRAKVERVAASFEIAPRLLKRWRAWLGNDALWPAATTFTHGELYAAHVLMDSPDRIVGVLDWTTAQVGDPAVDFTYQQMMGEATFEATHAAYIEAGGVEHPNLAERCSELAAASPLVYGLFALQTQDPRHRASAAEQLQAGE